VITLTGSDQDGDARAFTVITPPEHGTLGSIGTVSCSGSPSNCSENVTYTPFADYNGDDSFTYMVTDIHSVESTPATVSLTVTPVNDAPAANNDGATVAEGGTVTVLDSKIARAPCRDTVADGDTVTAMTHRDAAHGSVTLNADGTVSYSHDGSETATESFPYKTCDIGTTNGATDGKCSGTATVSLTVTPVNDAPVSVGDSATVAEGGTVTVLDS